MLTWDAFWNMVLINPMVNALIGLYSVLGQNFGLAIIVFTIVIRLVTLPLSIRQQRNAQEMQKLQPKIKEIQDKYKSNPQKMQEEMAKIGYNPTMMLGGCLPMLIQFPIWIGLYRAITSAMAATPLDLFNLSQHLYPWATGLTALIPLNPSFLGIPNLAYPIPESVLFGVGRFILPVLVAGTTYLQQKLMTPPSPDPQSAAMSNQMAIMMPLMLGFFALNFSSGLAIYWTASNIFGIGQYWLLPRLGLAPAITTPPAVSPARAAVPEATTETNSEPRPLRPAAKAPTDGRSGSARKPVKARRKK